MVSTAKYHPYKLIGIYGRCSNYTITCVFYKSLLQSLRARHSVDLVLRVEEEEVEPDEYVKRRTKRGTGRYVYRNPPGGPARMFCYVSHIIHIIYVCRSCRSNVSSRVLAGVGILLMLVSSVVVDGEAMAASRIRRGMVIPRGRAAKEETVYVNMSACIVRMDTISRRDRPSVRHPLAKDVLPTMNDGW